MSTNINNGRTFTMKIAFNEAAIRANVNKSCAFAFRGGDGVLYTKRRDAAKHGNVRKVFTYRAWDGTHFEMAEDAIQRNLTIAKKRKAATKVSFRNLAKKKAMEVANTLPWGCKIAARDALYRVMMDNRYMIGSNLR